MKLRPLSYAYSCLRAPPFPYDSALRHLTVISSMFGDTHWMLGRLVSQEVVREVAAVGALILQGE